VSRVYTRCVSVAVCVCVGAVPRTHTHTHTHTYTHTHNTHKTHTHTHTDGAVESWSNKGTCDDRVPRCAQPLRARRTISSGRSRASTRRRASTTCSSTTATRTRMSTVSLALPPSSSSLPLPLVHALFFPLALCSFSGKHHMPFLHGDEDQLVDAASMYILFIAIHMLRRYTTCRHLVFSRSWMRVVADHHHFRLVPPVAHMRAPTTEEIEQHS